MRQRTFECLRFRALLFSKLPVRQRTLDDRTRCIF
ncbi:conserved hypothetical protein [Nitrosomonas nitrosa]|uniref:Uncharacterized protein n=1 Tax=Nitrosomonas nitrosa TaxID=52442 RepID=A0A8H8YZX5_9PROT|nr:conserved hypothetical protein [Nitrosomonas nitrosa]